MPEYQPYWSARAELKGKTGAYREARQCYDLPLDWSATAPFANSCGGVRKVSVEPAQEVRA